MKISNEKLKLVASFGREMYRDSDTPDIERIAGLFPRGFLSIVASQAGSGKTWFMQYITCNLSLGGNILLGLVPNSPAYKSIIFSGETGSFLLNKRLSKTNWGYNPSLIKVYSSVDMGLKELNCMINTPEGQETIVAIVHQEHPDIIFFDTLISFHSVDESKQGEMTAVFMFLLRLAKSFNCAVVINHHTRKRPVNQSEKKFTQEDVIGSSAGVRLASSVYIITSQEGEEHMPVMTVVNVKDWDKKSPSFSYQFITNDDDFLDFKISFDVEGQNVLWTVKERLSRLVESLSPGALIDPQTVGKKLGVHPDTITMYCGELVKKGILVVNITSKVFSNRKIFQLPPLES